MALANCGECGEKVSNRARICPRCGVPLGEVSAWRSIWIVVCILVIALMFVGFVLLGIETVSLFSLVILATMITLTLLFWYVGHR